MEATKYRIKIIELNNGDKQYVPQREEMVTYGSRLVRQELVWCDIIKEGDVYTTSKTITEYYKSEDEALEVIEKCKNIEIKSITFKTID